MDEAQTDDGPAKKSCPRCEKEMEADSDFCPKCGLDLNVREGSVDVAQRQYDHYIPPLRVGVQRSTLQAIKEVARGLGAVTSLINLALVFINVIILVWGISIVLPQTADSSTYLYLAIPFLVNIAELTGLPFAIYFLLLVGALVASFAYMLYHSVDKLKDEIAFKYRGGGHSPIYRISTIFFAVLAFNVAYYSILALVGINPTTPDFGTRDLWKLIYGFANASVWEELICRVLYIGVPLFLVQAYLSTRSSTASVDKKPWYRFIIGGGFSIGRYEKFFLVFSSAMFATAHIFAWDIYKVLPTFIVGMALGYLFLRFGLYASIMLHFFIDYLSMPIEVFKGDTGDNLLGFLILVFVLIGLIYLAYYLAKGLELFTGRKVVLERDIAPVTLPAAMPEYRAAPAIATPSNFGFSCNYCGATEARYKDGQFECLRCGRHN